MLCCLKALSLRGSELQGFSTDTMMPSARSSRIAIFTFPTIRLAMYSSIFCFRVFFTQGTPSGCSFDLTRVFNSFGVLVAILLCHVTNPAGLSFGHRDIPKELHGGSK